MAISPPGAPATAQPPGTPLRKGLIPAVTPFLITVPSKPQTNAGDTSAGPQHHTPQDVGVAWPWGSQLQGGTGEPGCRGEAQLCVCCRPFSPDYRASRLRSGSWRAPELLISDSWGQVLVQFGDQSRKPNVLLRSMLLAGARSGSEGHREPEEPKLNLFSPGTSRKWSNCQAH